MTDTATDTERIALGRQIAEARERRGWSHQTLAVLVGVPATRIRDVEAGGEADASLRDRLQVALAETLAAVDAEP